MTHPLPPRTFTPGRRLFKTLLSVLAGTACAGWFSASATPVLHGISAANVTVQQNDTANTTASVTLIPTLSVNYLQVLNGANSGNSRADYFLQVSNTIKNNVTNGIMLSSLTDNGRDNGEGTGVSYGTCAVDSGATGTPGSSGQWWVPVFGSLYSSTDGTYTYPEYNFDFAAAYFPYAQGWYGGWLVNSGGTNNGVVANIADDHWIGNPNMVLGTNVIPLGGGKVTVNLLQFGLDSRSNAILLCVGGKNEENFADSQTNADGTWTVTCRDDITGSAEADPSAFVCVPLTNQMVVAGTFMGNATIAMQNAPFDVTHVSKGTYHLSIPGVTPGQGVLIISGEEGGGNNGDNFVSYQVNTNGWDIQTRDTGTGPNLQDLPATDAVASFIYIPGATPGFTITPTNGLVTTENGAAATFQVKLDGPPTTNVTIGLASSQPSLATASPSSLTFNYTNWNTPQTVTVTGVANTVANGGPIPYTVDFTPAVSSDPTYNGVQAASVSLINVESDQPGVTVWPTNGVVTTESGGTGTIYVLLDSQPANSVTIGVSSSNPGEGAVSPASLTFNSSNWSVPQAVTVTGVDDSVVDGNIAYTIIMAPAVSSDPNYNGLDPMDVSALNLDNDVAGLTISTGNSISVVEGGTANFTVALSAQPVSDVTVTYASSNPSVGTLSPTTLDFTPANWNVPQTITLTGVANSVNGGNVSYYLTASVTSTNPGYSTLVVPNLNATTVEQLGLTLPSGQAVYGFGMAPVEIDGAAIVTNNAGGDSLSGASIAFAVTANANAGDLLSIGTNNLAVSQISLSGNTVNYAGSPIGTFTGGSGTTPLTVTLQNGVTLEALQALVRTISFSTTSTTDYGARTVLVTLNDGLGDTITTSDVIRVGLLRVTQFQNGADYGYGTYAGNVATELQQANPGTNYPEGNSVANGLFVDYPVPAAGNEDQVLIRFDDLIGTNAGQIPPGSIIVAADLDINVINTGNGGMLNRMLIPWNVTNASWNAFGDIYGDTGVYADDVTARSEYDSQLGVYIVDPSTGDVGSGVTGTGYVSIGVTPDIQAWASGEENDGWFFHGFDQETDGMGFSPTDDPIVANHPRLRVYWVPAGTAGATFSYGVNGYTNTSDAEILQATPDVSTAAGVTIWSDANDIGQADTTEALLQFNNLIGTATNQIPANAHIEVAMLTLASVNTAASMGDGGQFFALLQPWQDTNTTWNSWGPNGIQADGTEAAANATATAGSPTLNPNVQGGYHSFEVTPDVQNWANGTSPDYGWAVIPWPGGSDGWGFATSEDPDVTNHPQLVVYYSLVSGGTAAQPALQPLTLSSSQVQVNFTGTSGDTYTVYRATSLNGTWSVLGTAQVNGSGTGTITDPNPPTSGSVFYRVSYP